jgi:hypothetical protein
VAQLQVLPQIALADSQITPSSASWAEGSHWSELVRGGSASALGGHSGFGLNFGVGLNLGVGDDREEPVEDNKFD